MASVATAGPFSTKRLDQLRETTRVAFAVSRDGLMPDRLASVWERTRTPVLLTAGFAIPIALIAAFVPLPEIPELVNIGTLFAFLIVNIAVIWLRRSKRSGS